VLEPASMVGRPEGAYQQRRSDPENDGVRVEMVKICNALDAPAGKKEDDSRRASDRKGKEKKRRGEMEG